ncbi:ATP-binding protein [Athalassotoga saccharophila]|uniref:ATP-binding protein n=1 Tax=Athalassotoga saccharophila TaxID=1441386 RepID=UPI00137A143F|nr:ATP-binding protein [Athalassotoga saccharophila]BBJ27824.1 sensor protein ZraS [Athalassotoga saccharophila]
MPVEFYFNFASFIANLILFFVALRYYFYAKKTLNPYLILMVTTSFLWNVALFFDMIDLTTSTALLSVFFILFGIIPVLMISYAFRFKVLYFFEFGILLVGSILTYFFLFSKTDLVSLGILSTLNVVFSIFFMTKKYTDIISFFARSKVQTYIVFYGLFEVLEVIIFWLWIYHNVMWPYISVMNSILIPIYLYTIVDLVYEIRMVQISKAFLKNILYGSMISLLISFILIISYYTNFYFSKSSSLIQFFSISFIVIFLSFLVFGDYLQKIDEFFERILRTGRGYKREKTINFVRKSLEIDSLEDLEPLIVDYASSVLNTEDIELFFKDDDGNYRSLKRTLSQKEIPCGDILKVVDLYSLPSAGVFSEKELLVWMKNAGKVEGFMVLGHKKSGRYSSEDLEWIDTLSNHLTFFLSRYRSIQRVMKIEKQMIFQERMAALGKLSSGVTHEIRNPLNIISTSIQMLKKGTDPHQNEKLWKYIDEELSRINSILENFLYFARQKPPVVEEGDPVEIVKKIALLLSESASKRSIEIRTSFPSPFLAKFDKSMLMEILLNIGTNALDAVDEGKWISFEVEKFENHFRISVSNNGKVIPQSDLQRIFEPFYTTKENGTGLGLSIVYNYVNAMGGKIDVKSDEDETRFSITLPVEVKA